MHVNAIGNQSKGDAAATAGLPHGAWSAVMESRHGVERVGEHAHPLIKGCRGLLSGGCAVAQGHGDSEGVQVGDQVLCARLFRGERDQADLCFKSRDPLVQFSKARWGNVRDRVSAPPLSRQKRTFQVRPQQAAPALFVQASGLAQHRKCSAQGLDATGDQGRGDGLDTITPQLLKKLQKSREIVGAEFREGQAEPTIDLKINSRGLSQSPFQLSPPMAALGGMGPISVITPSSLRVSQCRPWFGVVPGHWGSRTWVIRRMRAVWCGTMEVSPSPLVLPVAVTPSDPVQSSTSPRVAVIMGSDSDLPTLQPGIEVLETLNVAVEVRVLSAHRTPLEMVDFARDAHNRGLQVIVAGAGGAAHLPGMVASLTTLPVIGVPVRSTMLSGVDSLHSIVQMPGGIPVATVAIGGGLNAGLLAAQILALQDDGLQERLGAYRRQLHDTVTAKDQRLVELGSAAYLDAMATMRAKDNAR